LLGWLWTRPRCQIPGMSTTTSCYRRRLSNLFVSVVKPISLVVSCRIWIYTVRMVLHVTSYIYWYCITVESDYTVVFFAAGGRHTPGWNWVWKAYRSLLRKYRKNLKRLVRSTLSHTYDGILISLCSILSILHSFQKVGRMRYSTLLCFTLHCSALFPCWCNHQVTASIKIEWKTSSCDRVQPQIFPQINLYPDSFRTCLRGSSDANRYTPCSLPVCLHSTYL